MHSKKIVFGSSLQKTNLLADGIISDQLNQNLWVYTADCMPILFADKGIEMWPLYIVEEKDWKKIIRNLIRSFDKLGSSRNDLIVAIGPSISKINYLIDKKTLKIFMKIAIKKH